MNINYQSLVKYLIFFSLICFPIFSHLESIPIRIWDEARLAINAYEMHTNGDFIVKHFEGAPDMWSTKPPLMIWLQVLFIKLLGVRELSIRLPSAIAACLTCLFILFFSVRYLKNFWFGFIAGIVLTSSYGYITTHAARTGDHDALLTLFTTLYALSFFIFIETQKLKYLYFTFLAIILAALTKGIAGVLFAPALLFYALARRKAMDLIKNPHLYFGVGLFLLFVLGFYLLREHYNHGYIKAVIGNELVGRYFQTNEGHKASFWFYLRMLVDHQFGYWYLFVPCGVLVGFFHSEKIYRRLAGYSALLVVVYFIVISFGQTKLEWYSVPMFPFLAILVAIFLYFIFRLIQDSSFFPNILMANVLAFIFLFLVCITPYRQTIANIYGHPCKDFYRIGYLLKKAVKGKKNLGGYILLHNGYYAHNLFYVRILQDKGMAISLKTDWKNLKVNDRVLVHQQEVKDYITRHYSVDLLKNYHNVLFYKIKGRINDD